MPVAWQLGISLFMVRRGDAEHDSLKSFKYHVQSHNKSHLENRPCQNLTNPINSLLNILKQNFIIVILVFQPTSQIIHFKLTAASSANVENWNCQKYLLIMKLC